MKRLDIQPRRNYKGIIESQGFIFHALDNYYTEKAAYEFTEREILNIEKATQELFEMCQEAVAHVIKNDLWDRMFIPKKYSDWIKRSWNEDWCSFYARFDLAYKNGEIKLLEFNADTPTGLLEASVIQWYWLQDYNKRFDQFNSIHEKLVEHLKKCKEYFPEKLFISCIEDHTEDFITVKYIEECANQAGIQTEFVNVENISVDGQNKFITKDRQIINNIFKLYPYEWMFNEPFGEYLTEEQNFNVNWVEPPYKSILSNKMLLVLLYEMFPDSKYLLPAFYGKTNSDSYVKKPVYSREGSNIEVVIDHTMREYTSGDYGHEGFIYQDYFQLPEFNGNKPIVGSWIIGGEAAGIGIREGSGLITNNTSRFVSHYFCK